MAQTWTTVIRPKNRWFDLNLGELWSYRDLIVMFVKRDFKTMYKQTVLGPLWILLNPMLTTLMQVLVFGNIAELSTDGMPQFVFYMAGNTIWLYFSGCLTKTAGTFVNNANVFGKVYFPRLAAPISMVLSGMVTFAVQFFLFLIALWYYGRKGAVHPNVMVLFLPLILLQVSMLSLGCGIVISSLTTRYRDLAVLVTFGVQLWMYASAIVYPVSAVPEKWRDLLMLNPVVPAVEAFRYAFTGYGTFSAFYLFRAVGTSVVILAFGMIIFHKVEKTFMDTV